MHYCKNKPNAGLGGMRAGGLSTSEHQSHINSHLTWVNWLKVFLQCVHKHEEADTFVHRHPEYVYALIYLSFRRSRNS